MSSVINLHAKFEPEKFYHVIAKAVDGIKLFTNDENKFFFLKRFAVYIPNFADVYAYCLLNNHIHCLLRPKPVSKIEAYLNGLNKEDLTITHKRFLENIATSDFNELIETQLNYLFVSYVRSFNKVYQRKGGMFNKPFRCIEVQDDTHFSQLVIYIHANPVKHKLVKTLHNIIGRLIGQLFQIVIRLLKEMKCWNGSEDWKNLLKHIRYNQIFIITTV